MNSAAARAKIAVDVEIQPETRQARSTVLIATVDPEIRREIGELLKDYPVKVLWARSVEELRTMLLRERIAACFCGFWLVDGTYRDVVRHLRNQPVEIPAVIVCAPECPHEYKDYLAALKIRAFDFICHPYRKSDVERILPPDLGVRAQAEEKSSRGSGTESLQDSAS